MIKKMAMFALILGLFITNSIVVLASSEIANETLDEKKIKYVVEAFFDKYENISYDNEQTKLIEDIIELSSTEVTHKMEDRQVYSYARSYLELVDMMLQRRKCIKELSDIDLTEYNKKLSFSYNKIDINEKKAEVQVEVMKSWNYIFSPDIISSATDDYVFCLDKESENWKITLVKGITDTIEDDNINNMDDEISPYQKEQYINQLKKQYSTLRKRNNNNKIGWMLSPYSYDEKTRGSSGNYNGGNASRYALDHALNPSSDYTYFSKDCTNFISQCLYAGGIKQHVGTVYSDTCWFYKTSTNRSSSWTGANEFYRYVNSGVSKINKSNASWESAQIGDIIQMMSSGKAYHSLIVSGVAYSSYGRSDLLVCAHTNNRRHVSLNEYYSGSKVYHHIIGNK